MHPFPSMRAGGLKRVGRNWRNVVCGWAEDCICHRLPGSDVSSLVDSMGKDKCMDLPIGGTDSELHDKQELRNVRSPGKVGPDLASALSGTRLGRVIGWTSLSNWEERPWVKRVKRQRAEVNACLPGSVLLENVWCRMGLQMEAILPFSLALVVVD